LSSVLPSTFKGALETTISARHGFRDSQCA
jgi:hypothetical protein